MDGLRIPSLADKEMLRTRLTLKQLNDRNKWDERDVHKLGNGLSVTRDGRVVVEPRSDAPPTQAEQEDIADKFQRFEEWLKSEGAQERAANLPEGQVQKATDPVILVPGAGITPADLANEFGTPVDTTELITLCEDTGLYSALPEVVNGSKIESWRELDELVNASGTAYLSFAPGECPDFMRDNTGAPLTVDKKHIGKMVSLTESDILHSMASIAAGYGVKELVGPASVQGGRPEIFRESIKSLQDKEIKKLLILVLNGWDYLLVKGSVAARPNEFNGFENYVTAANGARSNVLQGAYSGTFSATRFDEWIAAACAKPTHVFGHPTSLQALKLGYWGLGAQQVNFNGPGSSVVAGLTFADVIQTAIGSLRLECDSRFTRTEHAATGEFSGDLFTMRMVHNGEPLVYKATQIPMQYKDLAPGCSAISFEVIAVTALIIKFMCAQGVYRSRFQGKVGDGCNYVFGS